MRRVGLALALTVTTGLGASPGAARAAAVDPARDALAVQLDRAGGAAQREGANPGRGTALLRTYGGVRALVVRANATIGDLRRDAPGSVREVQLGVWELSRAVFVVGGATLTVAAPQVSELRLVSRGRVFSTLAGRDGSVRVTGQRGHPVLVRSWQAEAAAPDRRLADGRGSVSVRGAARLDAEDARFEDLGFYEGRVSGVALVSRDGMPKPTGSLRRSDFVRNYFGGYSFEARGVVWADDRFVNNVIYGLDPHDDSDGFLVARNYAAHNGRHGIIFSRLCDDNVIRDNVSERNGWHGIVLDDGKLADGPSNRNRVFHNLVRDNGRVGISIDGSDDNRIWGNRVIDQPVGIRLFGRALGNRVTGNVVRDAGSIGVFVDRPAQANAIVGNSIADGPNGVRVRGAAQTAIVANHLTRLTRHGITVDGPRGASAGTIIERNVIAGRGQSPVLFAGHAEEGVALRANSETWDYPAAHDLARVLGWFVGPGVWGAILAAAVLGPLLFGVGGARARLRASGLLVVVGGLCALGVAALSGGDQPGRRTPVVVKPPPDARVAAAQGVGPHARAIVERVVTKDGHRTHPTWYHDSQLVPLGRSVFVAWNARNGVRAAQLRLSDLLLGDKVKVSVTKLGGNVDTTGTDTNRHDVPGLVADDAGRLHVIYGGGSIAQRNPARGPLHRSTVSRGDLKRLSPEQELAAGGGAAFDFEAVTDRSGVRHLIGQRGRGDTGSLVELRMAGDGHWLAPRRLIAGGYRRDGCVLAGRARGCNRFAIARMVAGRNGWLHLVWGYSEGSLGGRCQSDSGFCDHDLYYAVSEDAGETWRSADGRASVRIDAHHAIAHDDRAFRVVEGHVGVFKAIVVGPGGPLVVHTEVRDGHATLVARMLTAGTWRRSVIAKPGDANVDSWDGSPVLRGDRHGYTLWIPTGDRIFRFFSRDGGAWRGELAHRGPAWSLTGAPAPGNGRELLMWRGKQDQDRSEVVAAVMPAGG